ncbi:MAG: hypothetical protein KA450_15190, partial [Bacteroidia bacterium]|nr:hypothetical protein [Bacteroidia bacterium]
MKKLYLIIISIFIFCFSANSQQVVTGEYFFDTDPSLGIANSISFVADSAVFIDSIPINVTGLAVGYHWVYVRVKDSDNKWSHYRKQRFYVYDNSPIVQPIDTPKLVQAEYWIDSLPIAGTGTLINLTPDDIIFYNDTIQNLQLDTGGHVVSVRVKDGKGNWSLIKTDSVRIENYDLDVFINHSPFFRPNQKQKLQITVRNRGTTTLIDKYLVLDFNEAFDISMTNIPDTLDSVPISNINGALYFPALDKYVTLIWLGELKPLSDINFDVYINFPFFVQRTLDINISVEGPNNTSFQNDYNQTNNLDLIDESYFFCSQRDAILQLKDSIGLPNLLHSSVVDTLKFWYQNHANMFKSPLLLNKITAPFLNFSYGLTISQGLIDSLNKLIYINYQNFSYEDKYPDDTSEFISVINQPIENKISELVTCNCSQNFCVSSIFPPLPQNGSFWLTSACKLRCYCDCVNGKYKPDSRGHGGFDIAMAENDPLFKTQWKKNQTEVRAVFGGNVVHNNYGNSGKSKL